MATVDDDIREELARVICDALDEHMDVPTPGEITKSDYLTADAILASPVIVRIRAEERRAVWSEAARITRTYAEDWQPIVETIAEEFDGYAAAPTSIRSGSEEEHHA